MTTDRRGGDRDHDCSDDRTGESEAAPTFGTLFERAPPTVTPEAVRSTLAAVRSGDGE